MLSEQAISLIEENVIETHGFFNSHDMLPTWILSACVEDAINEQRWGSEYSPYLKGVVYNEIDRIMTEAINRMDKI